MNGANLSIWLKLAVVAMLVWSAAASLPNLLTPEQRAALPGFMPQHAMTLGLDLQGGAHLVLEVSQADVLTKAYENLEDQVRELGRSQNLGYTGLASRADGVTLTLRDPVQVTMLREELAREQVQVNLTEGNQATLTFGESFLTELQKRALAQTVQVLRSRVDQFGVAEPVIQQQGSNRVIVELPGVRDVARAKAAIGKTAQLNFHLVDETATASAGSGMVPPGKLLLQEELGGTTRPLLVERRPSLTGQMLTSAAAAFDQYGNPAVDIAFDSRGTQLFAKLSTENVGKRFAIVLDGKVYSAPVFREAILGGRAQISGAFTPEESQDLAAVLNAGALPAKVEVVEERTIGPSLGADSVNAGMVAMGMGLAAVLVFMFLFYGLFGLAANVAVLFNLTLLVAVMSAMGFTLTLPGMAGMVLTLGMAVDANVLIFERMREEVANGKKPLAAILGGFEGAFRTILDGHVTTLVAAFVMFVFGSGPVKGFAVALAIGLVVSLFTSVTLTRWMILSYYKRVRPALLPL
ncbi:MAG: protein translocase subunit SecD [Alphaproteobacteria bacterium]|nr:protein translocase subunit SecD [Alphaproteobacteria bacterium]